MAICNTNTVVRSYRDNQLSKIINSFDIKTPDGFPIAKSSSILYKNGQSRVDGYNVFLTTINDGLSQNTSHYFYGSEELVLKKLIGKLKKDFPNINIVGFLCKSTFVFFQSTIGFVLMYSTTVEAIVFIQYAFLQQK